MEPTTCLFIGGAKPKTYVSGEFQKLKQARMVMSVQNDFQNMIEFAAAQSYELGMGAGEFEKRMEISGVLLNEDISDQIFKLLKRGNGSGAYQDQIQSINPIPYTSKDEVRDHVKEFLRSSITKHLFLFMAGHGEQEKPDAQTVQESFLLPTSGGDHELYTDKELTEDIQCMPDDKHLYIVIHSCHSGGMLNLWEMDTSDKSFALFASAEADILAEWTSAVGQRGYVQSFCEHAIPGRPLKDIAEGILLACANVDAERRPAFLTSKPSFADELFGQSRKSS